MKKIFQLIFFCSLPILAQSFHSITIDGNNDFTTEAERFNTTSGSTLYGYVTWDKTFFYIGFSGNSPSGPVTDNNRVYHIYIDSDPQQNPLTGSGTNDGETWRYDPTLPFKANYHYAFKTIDNSEFRKYFNGSDWVNASFSSSNWKGNGFWELKLRRSDFGSSNQINIVAYVEEDWDGGSICGGLPSNLFTNRTGGGSITFNSSWLNINFLDQIYPNVSYHQSNWGWWVRLNAAVSDLKDTTTYAGMTLNATNGFDSGIDLPKPPSAPSNYIEVYFPHSDWTSALGPNYMRDFKALVSLDSATSLWNFTVATDKRNSPVTLTADMFSDVPDTYDIMLYDISADSTHDLRISNSYQYNSGTEVTRYFRLIIGVTFTSPNINANATSFNFGTVKTNDDSTVTLTITNTGDSVLRISNITNSLSVYTFTGGTNYTIVKNASVDIPITFAPTATATYNDTLVIYSNDPDTPQLKIPLSGSGQTLTPVASLSVSSLTFGSVRVGRDTTLSFRVYNSGDTALVVTSLSSSNDRFTTSTTFPFSVNVNDSATVTVRFAPTAAQNYSGVFSVISNDPNPSRDTLQIDLSGSGYVLTPSISASTSALSFGNVMADYSSTQSFRIYNTGDTTLLVNGFFTTNSGFTVTTSAPLTVNVNDSAQVTVKFHPLAINEFSGILGILSNDPNTDTLTISLSGNGISVSSEKAFSAGWNLISIPVTPSNGTPAAVVGDDFATYFVYSYNGSGGYTNTDTMKTGYGYWLGVESAGTVDINGTPNVDTVKHEINAGWNLVSSPFVRSYSASSVYFRRNNELVRADSAVSLGWIQNVYYTYQQSDSSYTTATQLNTWAGYWFSALTDSVSMVFLHDSTVTEISDSKGTDIKSDVNNWSVTITAKANGKKDNLLIFGVNSLANNGFDARFDIAKPPIAPASDAIETYFEQFNWSPYFTKYASDIRKAFNIPQGGESWHFKVMSKADGAVSLSWTDILNSIPQVIRDNYKFELSGYGISSPLNMLTTHSYVFTAQAGEVYSFAVSSIITGVEGVTPDKLEFGLKQNYPNPFNPSTVISFSLAQSGETVLKVYDILGNEVATLISGNLTAGLHQVVFEAGKLPSGVYVYKLTQGNRSESRKLMLMK